MTGFSTQQFLPDEKSTIPFERNLLAAVFLSYCALSQSRSTLGRRCEKSIHPHTPLKKFSANGIFIVLLLSSKAESELNRKEVMKMKYSKLLLSVMVLAGALGLTEASTRAETVISKDVFTDGSYCHTKFESIREETLASGQPMLKDVDDIIDFYGPCNHDPLGAGEIQSQKLEMQHRFETEYND